MTSHNPERFRARSVLAGLAAGVVLSLLVFFAWRGLTGSSSISRTSDPAAIVREIQRLNELVSVKYTVQKVIGLEEKKVPVGSEKLLLIVQAEVLAGIDLSKITAANVTVLPDKRVRLVLPPPKIFHIVIDDKQTKVWDRRITWWTPWVPFNPDLERQARLAAKDAIEKAALEMGILDQAHRNAEAGIRTLLETLGVQLAPIDRS
ncbi:MAG: DUF4230 domain-containing protein [Bryobacteraceae bacterium]